MDNFLIFPIEEDDYSVYEAMIELIELYKANKINEAQLLIQLRLILDGIHSNI